MEQRHQELLKKQKALQEQYTRLQQSQRSSQPPPDLLQLKKTGSEGNLLLKMGLSMSAAAPISGSLTQLAVAAQPSAADDAAAVTTTTTTTTNNKNVGKSAAAVTTVSKVYETDII